MSDCMVHIAVAKVSALLRSAWQGRTAAMMTIANIHVCEQESMTHCMQTSELASAATYHGAACTLQKVITKCVHESVPCNST